MRVYFTDEAEADLEEISDYIALDNPERAVSFTEELRAGAFAIGRAPRAAPARPDLGTGLRAAVHRPYLIVFRIDRSQVQVLRIIHGARDVANVIRNK